MENIHNDFSKTLGKNNNFEFIDKFNKKQIVLYFKDKLVFTQKIRPKNPLNFQFIFFIHNKNIFSVNFYIFYINQ